MGPPSLDPSEVIGRVLGDRYRIARELASGGMATIYEAMHVTLGMNVARALALLDHPNIVRIVDFDLVGREPYMVLELLAGETLSARLLGGKILPDVALRIAAQLGSSVTASRTRHAG
jgi:serine/threonine protein kinase